MIRSSYLATLVLDLLGLGLGISYVAGALCLLLRLREIRVYMVCTRLIMYLYVACNTLVFRPRLSANLLRGRVLHVDNGSFMLRGGLFPYVRLPRIRG